MDRRTFLKTSVAAAAASSASIVFGDELNPHKDDGLSLIAPGPAELKLCSQASRLPGKTHKEKVAKLVQYGGVGYEVHPPFDPKEVMDAIAGTNVKIAAVCA